MARTLTFKIFRYNPFDENSVPKMQEYKLDETPRLNLYSALYRIKDELDPTLMFDFVCRAGICGSCGMTINGRPTLACRTLTKDLPDVIELHPLPFFKMLGDLSVDTGIWFREMAQSVESWIHTEKEFDPTAEEERMDNKIANDIYENERCIECGCCLAGCATAQVYTDFLGATGLNRIGRFMIDPRDKRTQEEWFELVSTDEGVFGCIGMMGCDDVCPKDLPLLEVFAYVRRKMMVSLTAK
ncbi:MAG: fumarate reductase iron-sulfur subunit [Candidatus Marinimicrobia bacterium]|nr:fumarate reductase iron-sulfur subunit [Candidatus Neomarinimicrobiota bacterium]MBL7108994.1 fumarate reductase iron-sulfur subunit [Candidatus Neomarinimicrobiota bacterium]